jgi:hypothetical protein
MAESPRSIAPYAAELLGGITVKNISEWARTDAVCRVMNRDPAIQSAMDAVKTKMEPALAWAKTKPDADGNSYSVLLKPQANETDLIDRIAAAFADVPAAPQIDPPSQAMADLLTLYPVFDAHIGMHAWSRETGSVDYDLRHAAEDMRQAIGKVMAITPDSQTAILLIGGDYFHADDNRAETPANRHKLDVDGRQFKVVDVGINILSHTIESLLGKHAKVIVRVMRGNHDEHAHLILTYALAERYRDNVRCEVQKDPRDLFMFQWGRSAIFAHHGDKAKPQQMAMYLSDVCEFWSATKHRHFFSGHVHHDHAKDLGPLRWESLRAFCPPDAYAASMGYGGRRALQSVTFHHEDGLVQRNYDPIQRAA